ncbi:counting factor associated protein D-like [Limanda limanda]|uniref:counting factor associated protein D-like n=1 Tax=Limanda limanda TaxID=27771 RepID=UPI0029C6939A|nr:counting factor associated protein D-like [Limanda limanda]
MWACFFPVAVPASQRKVVPSPPDFGSSYHVKGVISLPYSEIKEPFEAWIDLAAKSSRIDYYHGKVSTYQLAAEEPWGVSYKIGSETTEIDKNVKRCFLVNGTKNETVTPQASLPDVQGFQFLRREYYKCSLCEVWQNVTTVGNKKNTYTLWVTRSDTGADGKETNTPLHYEMMGYNTLLGSHYDKYWVDYKEFSTHVDPKDFSLPEAMSCEGFPGPGVEHHMLANPMRDLIDTSASGHLHNMFSHFKEKFQRQYSDEIEHEKREKAFLHSLRFIHSTNRKGLSFSVGVNHFSDRTRSELGIMTGRRKWLGCLSLWV